LGNGSRNTWDMTVTLPGRSPREFKGMKAENTKFNQLTWVGFTSNATKKTVFYLDNVKLTNKV